MENLEELISKLNTLPDGYISSKIINDKKYHYLQKRKLGKIVSSYIKECDLKFFKDALKEREDIEEKIRKYFSKGSSLKESLSLHDRQFTGSIMKKDIPVVSFSNGKITFIRYDICPLCFLKGSSLSYFLSKRTIDEDRVNSRLLKKALNIVNEKSELLPLYVYASTITDDYWFKPKGCKLHFKDISFKEDSYFELSLNGDFRFINNKPKRTPQLTLVGSYEKAWKKIDNKWWLYKVGNENERFSELFVSLLSKKLGILTAKYELDGNYIRSENFATKYNFEPMSFLAGEDSSYENGFEVCFNISKEIAKQYLLLMWFDCIVFNYDRHNENLGFLRSKRNGDIVCLSPNFDNNNSLISRGNVLLENRDNDLMIINFVKFINSNQKAKLLFKEIELPKLNKEIIKKCLDEISIKKDETNIINFLLNGEKILKCKIK